MNPKVEIEKVKSVVSNHVQDEQKTEQIIKDLVALIPEKEESKPHAKKQFVIVVSDKEGIIKKDLVGWVVQIEEDESPAVALEKIYKSSYEFNLSPKGRKMPIKAVGEAMEALPPRFCKENGVWIKTKEPVLVVTTNNVIPNGVPEEESESE